MSDLRLLYSNHVDSASITVGSVTSLPGSNLQTDDIQEIWKGASASGSAIILDFGAIVEIGAVALINTNLVTSDSVNIAISATDPTGAAGEIYAAGLHAADVNPIWRKYLRFIEPAVFGRYLRYSITIAQGPATAGRMVVGPTWIPTKDMLFGWEEPWRDFSVKSRSLGGMEYMDIRPRQRGYRFTVRGLSESEAREKAGTLNRLRGTGRDVLVCRDVDSDDLGKDTVWGLLEETVRLRQWSERRDLFEIELEVYDRV